VLTAPDWVNVVPVLKDPAGGVRFLMVRQYRHGIEKVTTEFPSGLVDPGEGPAEAAARELLEETGRTAGKLVLLGKISHNPPFMTNWCYSFLAEDLSDAGEQRLDPLEVLDVVEVPKGDLELSIGTGEYVNSLVMVALLWYNLRTVPES
jgi:ADP-ribose pyrophosphatase